MLMKTTNLQACNRFLMKQLALQTSFLTLDRECTSNWIKFGKLKADLNGI